MLRPNADAPIESVVQSASGGTLFVAHGSPTLLQGPTPAHRFLVKLGQMLPRPKAILCISSHWETSEPCLTGTRRPDTLTDMMSPAQTRYDCPGDPILARRAAECLRIAGMKVTLNNTRGIDHAVWDPLRCMAPAADVPVVELSVQPAKSVAHHYEVGQALVPLTREGYLVIGSGLAVQKSKFALADAGSEESTPIWAQAFDDWLTSALLEGRYEDVVDFRSKAPFANLAHPTSEHILPLVVALGAAGPQSKAHALNTGFGFSSISQACFYFQCQAPELDWTAQASGVNALPTSQFPGSRVNRIPIQRSKTKIKTLAGSRSTQMVVSEAHLEALQQCVLEQSQPEESNGYKSPLAERLETVIAASKQTPNADPFARNVSLNRKMSGLGNRKSTPQQNLRDSIRAQRASVEEVLKRGLAGSSRKRGGSMQKSSWDMTLIGSASQQRPLYQNLEQSASSHQPPVIETTDQLSSAHRFRPTNSAGASAEPLSSFSKSYGHSSLGRVPCDVEIASQPSDLDDQRGCCVTCGGPGMPLPSQAQTPSLEEAFSEFGMVPQEVPIMDKNVHRSGVHRALEELFGEPQNVGMLPSHSSRLGVENREPALERLLKSADSSKSWNLDTNQFSLQSLASPEKACIGVKPQGLRKAADGSQMQGLETFYQLRDRFEGTVIPSNPGIVADSQPQSLPTIQQSLLLDHGVLDPAFQQEGTLVANDGLDNFLFNNEPALEGNKQLDPATFAQEAAALAMLGGISQPDWLWAADSEMVSQQDDVMGGDTWGGDVTAAQESAADAMLAGMSQPDWLWDNSDTF